MYHENKIWIGKSGEEKVCIYPKMANRHGMIAGATGTGKTITLKVLAESFSDCGPRFPRWGPCCSEGFWASTISSRIFWQLFLR